MRTRENFSSFWLRNYLCLRTHIHLNWPRRLAKSHFCCYLLPLGTTRWHLLVLFKHQQNDCYHNFRSITQQELSASLIYEILFNFQSQLSFSHYIPLKEHFYGLKWEGAPIITPLWIEKNPIKRNEFRMSSVLHSISLISPQATISGADRPRAKIFTIFDQMNVTPRWEFLWVVNVNSAIIALSAPPPKHGQSVTMGK